MTQTSNDALRAKWWTGVYEYHQQEIAAHVVLAYAKDTNGYSRQDLDRVWHLWRSENKRAPMPSDLLKKLRPSNDEYAQGVVDCLWQAVHHNRWPRKFCKTFGNIVDLDAVYEFVGNVGQAVIEKSGGFRKMQLSAPDLKESFVKRDWKATALAVMASMERGETQLSLGSSASHSESLEQSRGILKLINNAATEKGEI